jgi:hypothetical protein
MSDRQERRAAMAAGEPRRPADPTTPAHASSHNDLAPDDREIVQDWMARRYLQLHDKQAGRRRTDLPMPATVKSPSQIERFVNYIRNVSRRSKP